MKLFQCQSDGAESHPFKEDRGLALSHLQGAGIRFGGLPSFFLGPILDPCLLLEGVPFLVV